MNEAVRTREIIHSNHHAFICLHSLLQARPGRTAEPRGDPEQVTTSSWSFFLFLFLFFKERGGGGGGGNINPGCSFDQLG